MPRKTNMEKKSDVPAVMHGRSATMHGGGATMHWRSPACYEGGRWGHDVCHSRRHSTILFLCCAILVTSDSNTFSDNHDLFQSRMQFNLYMCSRCVTNRAKVALPFPGLYAHSFPNQTIISLSSASICPATSRLGLGR